MKLMYPVLSILMGQLLLNGCQTVPLALTSPGHYHVATTINPALSAPEAGIHPSVSLSCLPVNGVGAIGIVDNPRNYSSISLNDFTVQGDLLLQPSLRGEIATGWFGSLTGRVGYSSIEVTPGTRDTLSTEQRRLIGEGSWSLFGETSTRIGGVAKFHTSAISLYGSFIAQYESAAYSDYRRRVDGMAQAYNFAMNPLTLGWSYGIDLSFGASSSDDIGLLLEFRDLFNNTQSAANERWEETNKSTKVQLVEGGVSSSFHNVKVGAYIDIERVRASLDVLTTDVTPSSGGNPMNAVVSVSYRL